MPVIGKTPKFMPIFITKWTPIIAISPTPNSLIKLFLDSEAILPILKHRAKSSEIKAKIPINPNF